MEMLQEVKAAAVNTASGGDGDGGDGSSGGGSGGSGGGSGGVLCGLFPPRLMLVAYTGGPAYALSMIRKFPSLYIGMSGAMTYAKVRGTFGHSRRTGYRGWEGDEGDGGYSSIK